MKDRCEDCGVTPEIPGYDLAECQGCGKTICVNDCVFESDIVNDVHELYWCGDCEGITGKENAPILKESK